MHLVYLNRSYTLSQHQDNTFYNIRYKNLQANTHLRRSLINFQILCYTAWLGAILKVCNLFKAAFKLPPLPSGTCNFYLPFPYLPYTVSVAPLRQFVLRSPLAAPMGDSWRLDPRWDVFNHFKTLSVIVLYSECVGCWIEVKIVKFNGME